MCFEAPAILAGQDRSTFAELGEQVGLAFQVKDALLDIDDGDDASFISFLGEAGTRQYLESLTEKIGASLKPMAGPGESLRQLIFYNLQRQN